MNQLPCDYGLTIAPTMLGVGYDHPEDPFTIRVSCNCPSMEAEAEPSLSDFSEEAADRFGDIAEINPANPDDVAMLHRLLDEYLAHMRGALAAMPNKNV